MAGVYWILASEALIAVWSVITLSGSAAPTIDQWRLGGFVAAGVAWHVRRTATGEESRRASRLKAEYVDHTGLWNVGAALALPLQLAILVLCGIRVHRWFRARRPPGRFLFTSASHLGSVLACHTVATASPALDWLRHGEPIPAAFYDSLLAILSVVAAAAAYYLSQTIMISVARALRPPEPRRRGEEEPALMVRLVGTKADNRELALTLLAGMFVAVATSALWGLPLLAMAVGAAAGTRYVQRTELRDRERQVDAHTDPKTGLYNHPGWGVEATSAMRLDEATGSGGAVLMIDSDGLKRVNDTYGHLVGNDLIEQLGTGIKDAVRATAPHHDVVARWGGDEFAVYLSNVDAAVALAVAERIRSDVENLVIKSTAAAGGDTIYLRTAVSIGVAAWDADAIRAADDPLGLMETTADRALYDAKQAGRNRVVHAANPTDVSIPVQSSGSEKELRKLI